MIDDCLIALPNSGKILVFITIFLLLPLFLKLTLYDGKLPMTHSEFSSRRVIDV